MGVLLVGAALVAGWFNFQNGIENNAREIEKIQAIAQTNDVTFLQLQKDIVEIKTTLEYIKLQVTSTKTDGK